MFLVNTFWIHNKLFSNHVLYYKKMTLVLFWFWSTFTCQRCVKRFNVIWTNLPFLIFVLKISFIRHFPDVVVLVEWKLSSTEIEILEFDFTRLTHVGFEAQMVGLESNEELILLLRIKKNITDYFTNIKIIIFLTKYILNFSYSQLEHQLLFIL